MDRSCSLEEETAMNRLKQIQTWTAGFVLCAIAMCLFSGCAATIPPPDPAGSESSALGIALKMRSPVKIVSKKPDLVFFARVEEGEDIKDLLRKWDLVPSTMTDGEDVYALNIAPGTYVAVAATYGADPPPPGLRAELVEIAPGISPELVEYVRGDNTYRNYLSRGLIEKSMITVEPGTFAFAGRLVGDQSVTFGEGDGMQWHFMKVLEGKATSESGLMSALGGEYSKRIDTHETDHSAETERKFLEKAREKLKGTGWVEQIDKRLKEM